MTTVHSSQHHRCRRHSIHDAIHGRLRDRPCFMFMGVNRVIHFHRCEVETINVGHCKVSESVNRTETGV